MTTGPFFQQEEVSEPGSLGGLENTFAIRRPDVRGAAERFFGAIIEVVAERGPDLRLELHRGQQGSIDNDHDIPAFFGAKIAGQFQALTVMNASLAQPGFNQQISAKNDETIEVPAPGNRRTLPRVLGASSQALLRGLVISDSPEVAHGATHSRLQVTHGS